MTEKEIETYNRSSAGAFGLPSESVSCEEVFRKESENIFHRNWICVGRFEQFQNESGCYPFEFENFLLLLVLDDDGNARCFHNVCRHRGSRLVDENQCHVTGQNIVCPYHAWSYNRKGELIGAPNMRDVDEFDNRQFGLNEIECRNWMGFLWIRLHHSETNFYPETTGLASIVAPWNISHLKIHKSIEYRVQANWKLIFQNYNECYHCPTVHPALNRLTPYKDSTNDFEEGPILGGPMKLADDAHTMSMDGQPAADPIQSLDDQQRRTVGYYTIFPTMFLSVHPDYVLVHLLERINCAETKVTCQFLFDPNSIVKDNFHPQPAIEFWDMTNRQDWHVCELTQQGMTSAGYQPGPYSNLESVVAAFDRYYHAEMS